MKLLTVAFLALISMVHTEVEHLKDQPLQPVPGMGTRYARWDESRHVWIDQLYRADPVLFYRTYDKAQRDRFIKNEKIPVKTRIVLKVNLYRHQNDYQLVVAAVVFPAQRKTVLFVNGPSQDPSDRFFGWPTPLLYAIAPTVEEVTTGALEIHIAGQIFDPWAYVEGANGDRIKSDFRQRMDGVDIVCASAIYDALYPTLQLFAEAKRLNPRIVTIVGGPHFDETHAIPTLSDIRSNPTLIDYAIAGDGEIALRELLRELSINSTADIRTVAARSLGQGWVYNNRSERAAFNRSLDLNSLPLMPIGLASQHHRLDFDVFTDNGGLSPTIQMIAARGCPFSCNFCSERRDLAAPNARSIESIVREIDVRKREGFKVVFFDDSTFGAFPKLRDLLHELSMTGMKFGSLNRFNVLANPKLVELYRQAGFVYAYCAIEQFDDEALKAMTKGQCTSQVVRGMQNLAEAGMQVGVSLLYGLPGETPASVDATLDFTAEWVERGAVKLVSESVLSFHPGTPEGRGKTMNFNCIPPHTGYPWNRFEEGQWHHPESVTEQYLENILQRSERRFSQALVRNRHSWTVREMGQTGPTR